MITYFLYSVLPFEIISKSVIGTKISEPLISFDKENDKIIAVAAGDPSVNHYNDISELPPHMITEIMSFFEDYTKLENKTVVVEKFFDKSTALVIMEDSFKMYKKHYGELHKWFFG